MAAVSHLSLFFLHERKKHGKLSVNQIFQGAGNRIIIQGKTPDGNVRPKQVLNDFLHIILYAALSGCMIPARKTAEAGLDIHTADRELFGLHIRKFLPDTLQKCGGQSVSIAAGIFWTAVDD